MIRAGTTTKGFYTPPPTKNHHHHSYYHTSTTTTAAAAATEPKLRACQTDDFHIRRKLPTGNSPYVRAKHVQLIDKDPGKAVSLFWSAINSGDRVDSALKDMAVVMKQLDRSDEAIEAIKSFRSLCHPQSQDSLDNVLVELYKRSGRIEEQIEILILKLKRVQRGEGFGGQRFKVTRAQGRRVQVTVEQETARILGNLAWAYLQLGEYKVAEDKYREGLLLEADKNMQCNLAYCLLQTRRIEEAKSLLDAVKSSSEEDKYIDESYVKSYERAVSKMIELEQENCRMKVKGPTATPRECTHQKQWRIDSDSRNQCRQLVEDSSPVVLTQPRSPWRLTNPDRRRKVWNGRVVGNSSRALSFEQTNVDSCNADNVDVGRNELDWRAKALEALPRSACCEKPSAETSMLSHSSKKSWADMVEEEELFAGVDTINRENKNPNRCSAPL